jgi:polyphosphate kinase
MPDPAPYILERPDAAPLDEITELASRAGAADGDPPFSDQTLVDLRATPDPRVRTVLARSPQGELVGASVGVSEDDGAAHLVELVVDPRHRRRGIGGALTAALAEVGTGTVRAWAHGGHPGAAALAARHGLTPVRDLHRLLRPLRGAQDLPLPGDLPAGYRLRSFEPGRDEQEWLRANAAAFADHPEQGRMTLDDLRQREAEPWFDAAGFLLAVPEDDPGTVAGFHWTKVHPAEGGRAPLGEVYAVGIVPEHQGAGLGRALTAAGVNHLAEQGLDEVMLYVDGDNTAALRLYERLGFRPWHLDVMYSGVLEPAGRDGAAGALAPRGHGDRDRIDDPVPAARQVLEGRHGPERFLDREASWIAFNTRVLELAEDPELFLLERVQFLSIVASNLDEFFMVRVAGLKRRIATGIARPSASGCSPAEQMETIAVHAHALQHRHARAFHELVRPELARENIHLVRWTDLDSPTRERISRDFHQGVFPILTPLAVDPAHPFPYISGLSLNLAVMVRNPQTGKRLFARVKVPDQLPRLLAVDGARSRNLPGQAARFVALEDVIAEHLDDLFPGMEVEEHHVFRVTRNEDLEVEEDDAENLLQALEKELLRRRFGPAVRLEVTESISDEVLELLVSELGIDGSEIYRLPAPLDLRGLGVIAGIDRPELHYPRHVAHTSRYLNATETAKAADVFAATRARDVLLHHPYDSFATSVQAFLEQAAADPKVQAIKQTLYRTSGDSPIVDALIDAAEAGKQVLALVEIKARFDEQANISWARKLEQAGVHVVYGIVGLKTHCKLSLVVRQEDHGLRRYVHIGTGNYHPSTARFYEDLGLLTCDPEVGEDVSRLFNQLSGYAPKTTFKRLLVAPRSVRSGLIDLVEAEIRHHRAGHPARIQVKCNSIVDEAVIDALYRASQAGVPVDVVVRGICALRPGVPGLSETIRVRSILGRFLEHSRMFAFANGGEPAVYIGSADMMHRNLDRRVETLVRITAPRQARALVDLLHRYVSDTTSSWHLDTEGRWTRHHRDAAGRPLQDIQEHLLESRIQGRRTL